MILFDKKCVGKVSMELAGVGKTTDRVITEIFCLQSNWPCVVIERKKKRKQTAPFYTD